MLNWTFHTSYKGWKHRELSIFRGVAGAFHTSYKGWKRKRTVLEAFLPWAFHTSYKGWKPKFRNNDRFSASGFSYFL